MDQDLDNLNESNESSSADLDSDPTGGAENENLDDLDKQADEETMAALREELEKDSSFTTNDSLYNILLVEDDRKDTLLIEKRIKKFWPKAEINHVRSLRHACMECAAKNFNIILLDLNLTDAMGPRTVEGVRAYNKSAPIIVLSGMLPSLTIKEVMKYGANQVMAKSYIETSEFEDLLEENVA